MEPRNQFMEPLNRSQEERYFQQATLLSANQVQPNSFNINTYYTQYITAYGDGFFNLGSIKQKDSMYDSDAFNAFIDSTIETIASIYVDYLSENNCLDFVTSGDAIKLKYSAALQLDNDKKKKLF